MLEGLNAINWKSYGAEYMPDLIRKITSSDRRVSLDAYNALELIFHPLPTGVWEEMDDIAIQMLLKTGLPLLVVPFLIELVQSEAITQRENILQLLADISRYREYVENEVDWERAIQSFEAVKVGMPIYQRLLNDPDSPVKRMASEVIWNLNKPDDSL